MPVLKMIRRELYAQARSRGLTQRDAYLEAGYESNSTDGSCKAAIRLENVPEVRARIDDLLEATHDIRVEREEKRKDLVAFDDAMGKVEILQGLRTVFELAIRQPELKDEDGEVIAFGPADNLGAANRALELMGKQEGMFADTKHMHMHNDADNMGKAALMAAIEKIDAQLQASNLIVSVPGDNAKPVTVIDQAAIEG